METVTLRSGDKVRIRPAHGVSGLLLRRGAGDFFFRVPHDDGSFTDYEICHTDLKITIAGDEECGFYDIDSLDKHYLDHAPRTLGLVTHEEP